jgi:DNA repair exonuclease SbcCD nuclease subunit
MPRFLHTADWQIGRAYPRFAPDDAAQLAEARLDTVARIAALASEHRVDAVLVAGDVFDAQTVSDKTVRRLFNALSGFEGSWLVIPGNHDAALAASVWTRARRLGCIPSNVHALERPGCHLFESLGFALLAAPLVQRHVHADLTGWFDEAATPPHLARVGIAHGCVEGILPETVDSANPIAADRATRARLDYLALGDWHGTRRIDARTWYSGTPEPDRFRGNDPGNVLLVDVAAPGAEPQVRPLPVAAYRWHEVRAEVSVASDVEALATQLAGLSSRDVVALRVAGRVDLEARERIARLVGEAQGRVRAFDADLAGLRLRPTDADIARLAADGYLGEVLAELREAAARGGETGIVARGAAGNAPGAGFTSAVGTRADDTSADDAPGNDTPADDAAVAGEALDILAGLLAERRA